LSLPLPFTYIFSIFPTSKNSDAKAILSSFPSSSFEIGLQAVSDQLRSAIVISFSFHHLFRFRHVNPSPLFLGNTQLNSFFFRTDWPRNLIKASRKTSFFYFWHRLLPIFQLPASLISHIPFAVHFLGILLRHMPFSVSFFRP
jgi:hypothetical protein